MSVQSTAVAVGLDDATEAPSRYSVSDAARELPQDPHLPWRDRFFDDQWVAEMFADRLGERGRLEIQRVERLRAKYRIGESLRMVHRVWIDDAPHLVSMRMRATGADTMFADARRGERTCSPLRGVWYAADLQAVFWTAPNDRCLTGLETLATPPTLAGQIYPGALEIEVVGYNPERAAIARLSTHSEGAVGFVKLYAGNDLEPARRALLWLEHATAAVSSPLRVPRLRAWDDRRRLLIVDRVAGQHLESVPETQLVEAFTALGTALARLHALPSDASLISLPRFDAFDDEQLRRASEVVAWARPSLAECARHTVDLLVAHRPSAHERVCVHGDMNARNWLFARAGSAVSTRSAQMASGDVGFIDFDVAASGPAAADLGSVLALLRARARTGTWTLQREADLAAAVRAGYGAVRPSPAERELRWFQAAALLVERALRSVTRVRPDQLACLESIVADAHAHAVEVSRG